MVSQQLRGNMIKKYILLLTVICLGFGCSSYGLKQKKLHPIQPIPYSQLNNTEIKTNIAVVTTDGEIVSIPLIVKKHPLGTDTIIVPPIDLNAEKKKIVKLSKPKFFQPQMFYVIPDSGYKVNSITTNIKNFPEAPKPRWTPKAKLAWYYLVVTVIFLIIKFLGGYLKRVWTHWLAPKNPFDKPEPVDQNPINLQPAVHQEPIVPVQAPEQPPPEISKPS